MHGRKRESYPFSASPLLISSFSPTVPVCPSPHGGAYLASGPASPFTLCNEILKRVGALQLNLSLKLPKNPTVLAGWTPEEAASAIWTPGFPRTDQPENKCVFALGRTAGL